jgi:hypothetical protein
MPGEGGRLADNLVHFAVVVGSPAGDTDIERLKRAADLHCPVLDDLRAPIPVELSWRRADAPR